MLPICQGVSGPFLDDPSPYRLLAPHAPRKRQIWSTPFASPRRPLGDASTDRLKVQHRNLIGPSGQNRTQQESCRNSALQHPTEIHDTTHFSRLGLTPREIDGASIVSRLSFSSTADTGSIRREAASMSHCNLFGINEVCLSAKVENRVACVGHPGPVNTSGSCRSRLIGSD